MKAERRVGTVSRGIRCPIFREGDNLAEQVVERPSESYGRFFPETDSPSA